MSRTPSALLELLRALSQRPSDAQLAPCIDALVEYAAVSRQPAMSAAALVRSQTKPLGLSAAVARRLTGAATEHFRDQRRRQEREGRRNADHAPLKVAAACLGELEADLRAKLIDPAQRRLYGWPYWNLTTSTFMVPTLACRGATRATFLLGLPEAEPLAIAATLPEWCRR